MKRMLVALTLVLSFTPSALLAGAYCEPGSPNYFACNQAEWERQQERQRDDQKRQQERQQDEQKRQEERRQDEQKRQQERQQDQQEAERRHNR